MGNHQRVRLPGRHAFLLYQFHMVSRQPSGKIERTVAEIRPRSHLPPHCRNLHTFHAARPEKCRRMGMGDFHLRLAIRPHRFHPQLQKTERTQPSRNLLLRSDGSQHPDCHETPNEPSGVNTRHARFLVAGGRRSLLHRRRNILFAEKTLHACRFPPVLPGRKHRAYHRYPADSVTTETDTKKKAIYPRQPIFY